MLWRRKRSVTFSKSLKFNSETLMENSRIWYFVPHKIHNKFHFLKHPVPCTARLQRTKNIKKVSLATAEKVWFCGRFSPRKNSEFRALTKSALKSRENMTSRTYVCAKNVCIQAFSESILGVNCKERGGVLELQPSVCFWDAIKPPVRELRNRLLRHFYRLLHQRYLEGTLAIT